MRHNQVGGIFAIIGGFILHLTLGTLYCFGNMNTYMTSYLRTHVEGQARIVTSDREGKFYEEWLAIKCAFVK